MSFTKHKKSDQKPQKDGAKKSATRKNPSKSGGVKGPDRREARKTADRKVEGRRGEPRAGGDRKVSARREERKAFAETRKTAGRRNEARKVDSHRSPRHGVNERFAAKSGALDAERPAPKTRSLRSAADRFAPRGEARAPERVVPKSVGRRLSTERFTPQTEARGDGGERVSRRESSKGAGERSSGKGEGRTAGDRFARKGESAGAPKGRSPASARFAAKGEARKAAAAQQRGAGKPGPRGAGKARFGDKPERKLTAGRAAGKVERKPAADRFAGNAERKPAADRFAGKAERKPAADRFAGKAERKPAANRVAGKSAATRSVGGERRGGERLVRKASARDLDGDSFEAPRDSGDTAKSAKPTHTRPFRPRPSMPQSILRAEKPVERKRPDMSEEPHPGHFLLTCREGSEQDLVDELVLAGIVDPPPRILAPALVLAPKVPKLEKRPVELTFARQGFPIVQSVHAHDLEEIGQRVARSLRGQLEKAKEYALHVWVPDSELGNPLASMADQLEAKVVSVLAETLPDAKRVEDSVLRRQGSMLFAQVCLIDPERAVAGVTYSNAALSLARGGRTRVRVIGHFPSRAARKIEEAFAWLNLEPGAGELCVDLGAAPGGWTYVLAERRARVIAVDPAQLRPEILAKKGVSHVQQSAFDYKPDGEVDWLFCDMAWRPLEAAALLAKWGRNRWARLMIANIKLPMTKKAEIVERVKHILETEGDWKNIRVKQLYHDRDEVTLSAHVK